MDHVPTPQGATAVEWRVPLVAIFTYDFLGFEDFPSRCGFSKDGQLDLEHSSDDLTSMLQSWLYFGLLSEFLGRTITPADCVLEDDVQKPQTLNSTALSGLLDIWQAQLRGQGVDIVYQGTLPKIRKLLDIAIRGSLQFDHFHPSESDESYAVVCLSVKLLIST